MSSEAVTVRCSQGGRRGRRIARDTVVRLVAEGAGYCYKPSCPAGFLWYELEGGKAVKLAEVAHIVAASIDGPRGDRDATDENLASIENLILLCPTCHTVVDGAPDQFPVQLIRRWKADHEGFVDAALGVRQCASRTELRDGVSALLLENRAIWELYGPESEAAATLSPDAPVAWRSEVSRTVIPNNTGLIRMLDRNVSLLSAADRRALALFRVHARALEERHLGGVVNKAAPRFPREMDSILEGSG